MSEIKIEGGLILVSNNFRAEGASNYSTKIIKKDIVVNVPCDIVPKWECLPCNEKIVLIEKLVSNPRCLITQSTKLGYNDVTDLKHKRAEWIGCPQNSELFVSRISPEILIAGIHLASQGKLSNDNFIDEVINFSDDSHYYIIDKISIEEEQQFFVDRLESAISASIIFKPNIHDYFDEYQRLFGVNDSSDIKNINDLLSKAKSFLASIIEKKPTKGKVSEDRTYTIKCVL